MEAAEIAVGSQEHSREKESNSKTLLLSPHFNEIESFY
jgi:hypothetical protein